MQSERVRQDGAMTWIEHALWWHVYPLGACGAPIRRGPDDLDVVHRLTAPLDWLDHLVSLGCNGLQLGPVFASETHGYDTTDHLRIDPRLGSTDDFDRLVEACHARGLRVLLDGVFNHVGRAHPAYRAAVEHGPDHPDAAILAIRWPDGWEPGREPEDHGGVGRIDPSVGVRESVPGAEPGEERGGAAVADGMAGHGAEKGAAGECFVDGRRLA